MTAALAPVSFQGMTVRVFTDEHGEPWFVAGDVTQMLGYANGRAAVAALPERMKGSVALNDGTPGNPNRATLNEAGVNRLIMRSTLPNAEQVQDWLAEEVMPSIRRTGGYNTAPALPDITTAAGVLAMAEQFAETARALVASEAKVAELEPKADLADTFLIADKSDRLVREAAKLIGMKERDLRRFLLEQRLIYTKHARCGDVQYDFYADKAHYFTAREKVIDHQWGSCSHYTLFMTARGMELIVKRLRSEGALAVAS